MEAREDCNVGESGKAPGTRTASSCWDESYGEQSIELRTDPNESKTPDFTVSSMLAN